MLDKSAPLWRHPCERMPSPCDLERLYDEHASALFAFLLNFTRSEADTRDALQDLFLKLQPPPPSVPGPQSAWKREEQA